MMEELTITEEPGEIPTISRVETNTTMEELTITEEPGEIPTISRVETNTTMEELTLTESKILLALKSLNINRSLGPDEIVPRLVVELSKSVSHPLHTIFEASIKTASTSNNWKEGKISGIYKKGNMSLASNYRPVNITSILCKCMERIIRNHIIEYMKENFLFSQKQYGFISGCSTVLQLIKVLNNWTLELDSGNYTDVIYMDFQKVFDTVPHKKLINKLYSYNIRN